MLNLFFYYFSLGNNAIFERDDRFSQEMAYTKRAKYFLGWKCQLQMALRVSGEEIKQYG